MIVEHNAYNSELFGMKMGDVKDLRHSDEGCNVDEMLVQSRNLGFEHLSVKVRAQDKALANEFLSRGFALVDTQVEYEHSLSSIGSTQERSSFTVRPIMDCDLDALATISGESFSSTRWHSDPSLSKSLCDNYYRQWLLSCARGYAQHILVGEFDGIPVSFMTLRVIGSDGRIDLTAVEKSQRGRGFYRVMVNRSLIWARDNGLNRMLATTQIDNLGSRRTWCGEGFKPTGSWYVLHAFLGTR